jgi:hypothetical protein
MGIHLRIKRFNLQSQIHVRFPTPENQTNEQVYRQFSKTHNHFPTPENQTNEQVYRQFSKTHNHLIEHSDSGKVTSKKTQPNFL